MDDDIRKYIPELPNLGEVVTLRHLLTHTSGYREFLNTIAMTGRQLHRGDWIDRSELISIVQRQPELQNTPGSEFNYNNTGYGLLATVVERIGGKPFPDWMKENVFEPLKMNDTFVRTDPLTIIKRASQGYVQDDEGAYKNSPDFGGTIGAGGIYTTVSDLANWVKNFKGDELVKSGKFEQMSTPFKLSSGKSTGYGFGLYIDEYKGLARIHHGGADTAHRSMMMYFPNLEAAVITQSNYSNFKGSIVESVADQFFGLKFENKKDTPDSKNSDNVAFDPNTFAPATFDKFAGRYELNERPGFVLTISRADDKFHLQATGQERLEIVPAGPMNFKLIGVEANITFHQSSEGEIKRLTLHHNGEHPATKLAKDPWSPGEDQLGTYAGNYFSKELETFVEISVVDEALVAKIRRLEDMELSPTKALHFSSKSGFELEFEANEDGDFNSLKIGFGGRTRGIRFKRVHGEL